MLSKTIIAASALLSMAAAVPLQQHNKREVVWETSTHWDVTTMHVTTTVWLGPGETPPSEAAPASAAPTHYGHKHPHPKPHKPTVEPSPSPPPVASSPASPPPGSSPYSPPPPPASTPPPAPTSEPPAPQPSQPSGGSPTGQEYTGDITYYDVGLGSCGYTNNDSENIVAIPIGMMNNPANPNANPLCGQTITISYAGQEHTAKIVDTCGGCSGASIDLSPTLFQAVAPNGDGRVHGVKWWFNN